MTAAHTVTLTLATIITRLLHLVRTLPMPDDTRLLLFESCLPIPAELASSPWDNLPYPVRDQILTILQLTPNITR